LREWRSHGIMVSFWFIDRSIAWYK
jgi:hypothetical protein